jgi:hypothetical protein
MPQEERPQLQAAEAQKLSSDALFLAAIINTEGI